MSVLFLAHHRKAVTHYDLLGVKSDASLEEIKNAFFNKSKTVGSLFVLHLKKMSGHRRAAFHSIVSTFKLFPQWASVCFKCCGSLRK